MGQDVQVRVLHVSMREFVILTVVNAFVHLALWEKPVSSVSYKSYSLPIIDISCTLKLLNKIFPTFVLYAYCLAVG